MKFYIASRLDNVPTVKSVVDILKASGHKQTYDESIFVDAQTFKQGKQLLAVFLHVGNCDACQQRFTLRVDYGRLKTTITLP